MRLILASSLSSVGLIAHLQQRCARIGSRAADEMDVEESLALDDGPCVADAELAWLDGTLAKVSQPTLSMEAVRDDLADVNPDARTDVGSLSAMSAASVVPRV